MSKSQRKRMAKLEELREKKKHRSVALANIGCGRMPFRTVIRWTRCAHRYMRHGSASPRPAWCGHVETLSIHMGAGVWMAKCGDTRQHALTAEQNQLMRSSAGLGKKETKKQALKRALQMERAGLAVPDELQLYREVVPGSRDGSRDNLPAPPSARLPPAWSMAPPRREAEQEGEGEEQVPEHVQRRLTAAAARAAEAGMEVGATTRAYEAPDHYPHPATLLAAQPAAETDGAGGRKVRARKREMMIHNAVQRLCLHPWWIFVYVLLSCMAWRT
jgi:hypothetical protein